MDSSTTSVVEESMTCFLLISIYYSILVQIVTAIFIANKWTQQTDQEISFSSRVHEVFERTSNFYFYYMYQKTKPILVSIKSVLVLKLYSLCFRQSQERRGSQI